MNMTGSKEKTDHYGFIKTGKETAEDLLPQSESYDCFSLADEKIFFIEAVSPDSPTQLTADWQARQQDLHNERKMINTGTQ